MFVDTGMACTRFAAEFAALLLTITTGRRLPISPRAPAQSSPNRLHLEQVAEIGVQPLPSLCLCSFIVGSFPIRTLEIAIFNDQGTYEVFDEAAG